MFFRTAEKEIIETKEAPSTPPSSPTDPYIKSSVRSSYSEG